MGSALVTVKKEVMVETCTGTKIVERWPQGVTRGGGRERELDKETTLNTTAKGWAQNCHFTKMHNLN